MEQYQLKSIYFEKLKGLSDVNIKFDKRLTAIMGVNGSGKTTVIHALACIYKPDDDGKGENHIFPEFFVPNTDSLWKGSKFTITQTNSSKKENERVTSKRTYEKQFDRWAPRYEYRPKRNVYYIGIDSCLPEIEKSSRTSRIIYSSQALTDRVARKIVESSAYILNKSYDMLHDNVYQGKHLSGVSLKQGLHYSSLSMGTGEQRTLKILERLYRAEAYSLILIDEIDLLLHVSALRRLIIKIDEIAEQKHLQVVFTTHSMEMINLAKYVGIQYIQNNKFDDGSLVFDRITADLIYSLTGDSFRPYKIYVEDNLAKAIVQEILRKNNKSSEFEVSTFGSIENAFTLAASVVIQNEELDKWLIVLDGDKYCTDNEKLDQIKKKLSGTEQNAEEKQQKALKCIRQFVLPPNTAPEKMLYDTIIRVLPPTSDIYKSAEEISAVDDTHQWIDLITSRLAVTEKDIVVELFRYVAEDEKFQKYIGTVYEWIITRDNNETEIKPRGRER